MKPDWDKLMGEYKDSPTAAVVDVDCTAGGKSLCDANGVRGYPTIKYGDPNDLQDYKGGRSLKDFQKFASENLGPTCGPNNLDLCDAAKKAQIEELQKLAPADLDTKIAAEEKNAQEDYETMMADSADKRAEDSKTIADKTEMKAGLEGDLADGSANLASKKKELMATEGYLASLHAECDWQIGRAHV